MTDLLLNLADPMLAIVQLAQNAPPPAESPSFLERLLHPGFMPFMIPIVAIVFGVGFWVFKSHLRHTERMAMIKRGMDPDRYAETRSED